MVLHSLRLRQFRSYSDTSFHFDSGVNVVVGPNGTGKTNLLEAIYVLMYGVSFRVSDKELAHHDSTWFRLDGNFDDQQRTIRYQAAVAPAKQVSINDGAKRRFTRQLRIPVVLFEPDMLRVLSGSPARRRRLLDDFIAQWFDDGATVLRRYERVLMQRNAILKRAYDVPADLLDDQLFAWDVSFAELADTIEAYRYQVVATLNNLLADIYSRIAKKSQAIVVEYNGTRYGDTQQLLHTLRQHRRLDVARGYTTVGPHRSDFKVKLNHQPADVTASRGEQRSIVLAMKQVEIIEVERLHDSMPILLLDDVMSELDSSRQKALVSSVKGLQTIVTTTDTSTWEMDAVKITKLTH